MYKRQDYEPALIGRLSGNKCVIFDPSTATGKLRTSNKVPFAPSHRPLQDSMVKN